MSPTSISGKSLVQNSRKNAQKTTLKMTVIAHYGDAHIECVKSEAFIDFVGKPWTFNAKLSCKYSSEYLM